MQKTIGVLLSFCGALWITSVAYGAEYSFESYCTSPSENAIYLDATGVVVLDPTARGLNCSVEVQFAQHHGLLVTIVNITMMETANCTEGYFQVATLDKDPEPLGPKFCKTQAHTRETDVGMQVVVEPSQTDGSASLNLFSANNGSGDVKAFTLVLTTFKAVNPKTELCDSRFEHQCYNWRCIPMGIYCDGHNHCGGDRRPSGAECPGPVRPRDSMWGIATIAFGLLSTAILLPAFLWTAVRGGQIQVTSVIHKGQEKPVVSPSAPSINDPEAGAVVGEGPWVQSTEVWDRGAETTKDTAQLVRS